MSFQSAVLHLHPPGLELPLVAVLTIAGLGAALLLGLALAAYLQRKSRPYFLVALALLALFARSVIASLSMLGMLPGTQHHLFEHSLDIAMAAFVIGAVYYARTVDRQLDRGGPG